MKMTWGDADKTFIRVELLEGEKLANLRGPALGFSAGSVPVDPRNADYAYIVEELGTGSIAPFVPPFTKPST